MKTSIFILNVVSVILLLNFAFSSPSVTGFAITLSDKETTISNPLFFASIFIIATIALDVYFYMKSRKE